TGWGWGWGWAGGGGGAQSTIFRRIATASHAPRDRRRPDATGRGRGPADSNVDGARSGDCLVATPSLRAVSQPAAHALVGPASSSPRSLATRRNQHSRSRVAAVR